MGSVYRSNIVECCSAVRWRARFMLMVGCLGPCAMSVPVFSYGAMIPYIYSYLWMQGERFDMLQLNLHPSLFLMTVTSFGSIIGLLSKVFNERIIYATFSLFLSLIMLSMHWFGNTYLSLSLYMCALGICGGNVLVYIIGKAVEWNPSKSGSANGIIGFFIGISGLIGSFVCTVYINPHNEVTQKVFDPRYPELGNVTIFTNPSVYDKVPYLWIIFTIMLVALFIPSVIFVRSPTPDEVCEMTPLLEDSFEVNHLTSPHNYSVVEMVKTVKFWILYFIVMTMSLALLSGSELYKELAKDTILDDTFLNVIGAVLAIANAFGRLLWGLIMDKIGSRWSLFLAFSIIAPSTVLLYCTKYYPWPYLINVCVVSFNSGIFTGIAPALVELFGHRDISLKYSVCLSGELFGCSLFYILSIGSVKLYNDLTFLILIAVPCGISCLASLFMI